MSGLDVEAGADASMRYRNELAFDLAIGVAFALGGVWVMVNRSVHWSWVAFSFLLAVIPQSAIALGRPRLGWWRSTALGLGLFLLVAAAFRLSAWPVGTGDELSFISGFGAGSFLAAALRTRRHAQIQDLTP